MARSHIAILGATSHIAKGIILNYIKENDVELHLYVRNIRKIKKFISCWCVRCMGFIEIKDDFQDLFSNEYVAIINCVGVGTENKLSGDYFKYFEVTEFFDNLILNYLKINSDAIYINISSGIVYGDSDREGCEGEKSTISLSDARAREFCIVSNINSELKHRSFSDFNIVDLRVFSYFSRFADLREPYFVNQLVSAVIDQSIFVTNRYDMVRDYVHPDDLYQAVVLCINKKYINNAFDLYSLNSITKMKVIDLFVEKYGVDVEYDGDIPISGTGAKDIYCSSNEKLSGIGYVPTKSSIDVLFGESFEMVREHLKNTSILAKI